MSYLNSLAALGAPAVGTAPTVPPKNIGTAPVAAQPHIEPPPYDAGLDPAWKGILDPNDHALRNALSAMEPEVRQLLLARLGKIAMPASTPREQGAI